MKTLISIGVAILMSGFWISASARSDDVGGWNLAEDKEKIEKAYNEQKEFQEKERQRIEEIFRQGQALSAEKQKETERLTHAQAVNEDASLDAANRAAMANAARRRAQIQAEKAKTPEDKEVAERIREQAEKLVRDNVEQKNSYQIEGRPVAEEVVQRALEAQGQDALPPLPDENKLLKKVIGPDVLDALKPQLDLADAILKAHKDKLKGEGIERNTSPPKHPIPPDLFITTLQHDTGISRALIEHYYDGRKATGQTRMGEGSTYAKLLKEISSDSGSFGVSRNAVEKVVADQSRRRQRIEQERLAEERRRQEELRLAEERRQREQDRLAMIERQRQERERQEAEQRRREEEKRRKEEEERNRWKNPTRKNVTKDSDGSWEYTVHEFDRGNGLWDVVVWGRNTWPINAHEVSFWLEIPDGAWASISTDKWIQAYGTISPGKYAKQQFRFRNPANGRFKVWWKGSYWESEMKRAKVQYGSDWTVRGYRWIDP
ncbi:MAG: hypothetical protein H8E44_46505 [Planctomycetes bacterium]|nr:hypothetical protein [Planctomycetota bacterium]MBL7041257.1 hypothetical protein [Pirellulaceae bacterium]